MLERKKIIKAGSLSCALAVALGTPIVHSIEITSTLDADTLANALIIPGSGITVTSAFLIGGEFDDGYGGYAGCEDGCDFEVSSFNLLSGFLEPTGQAGIFTNTSGTYGLPSQGGIVLSSGFVEDYQDGPNNESGHTGGAGTAASAAQNDLLDDLSGYSTHFDPVELNITFDVADDVDTISFIAAFGSEEFPEFVNSSFIDAFGMFLNGVNVAGALPTGGVPGTDPLLPININHPDFAAVPGTELNGLIAPNGIPLLRFDVPVTPGSTGNTFSLVIADASDSALDSTVFLSSFGNFNSESGASEFTPILPNESNPTNEDGAFVFELPDIQPEQTIWIDPDVATGYVYETDGLFSSVTAPTLLTVNDVDGYELWFDLGLGDGLQSVLLAAGQTYHFTSGVSTFTLKGINPALGLDPADANAFALGVAFSQVGTFVTQNPIVTYIDDGAKPVSEPGTMALFGLSLLGLGVLRRRFNTK